MLVNPNFFWKEKQQFSIKLQEWFQYYEDFNFFFFVTRNYNKDLRKRWECIRGNQKEMWKPCMLCESIIHVHVQSFKMFSRPEILERCGLGLFWRGLLSTASLRRGADKKFNETRKSKVFLRRNINSHIRSLKWHKWFTIRQWPAVCVTRFNK